MTAIIQRPLRGSRISTFYPVKNLPSLASLDSAFQLQEYISLLIRLDVHDVNVIVSLPGNASGKDREKEKEKEPWVVVEGGGGSERKEKEDVDVDKGKGEPTVDEACWIYEQLRRLAQDLSHPLITTLQQECTRASCPEMKAGEWLYLCVAHGNDGATEHCCAIDYILHTVDSATALLNSPRTFPSRLQIPVASHRHFSALARRLGRIFAHAYFHHREAFEQAEAESSLYARFLALTERFDLVPAEFLVIPSNGHNVGGVANPLGLGPPPLRSPRDDHRRPNEFDRGYHQQQQQQPQRPRYDLDIVNFQHGSVQHQLPSNPLERNPSPPGPSSPDSSSGGIGESPSSSSRTRFGRHRTGTMVFSEAEANAVTDELAGKSVPEREGERQKIELLERDVVALKTVIPPTSSTHEEDDMQFEISLSPEERDSGEGGSSVVPESLEPVEKQEVPSLLDLNLESEAVGEMVAPPVPLEINVLVESSYPTSPNPVDKEKEAASADIVAEQPQTPAASAEPVTLIKAKSEDELLIPKETIADIPPTDDNVSIPEPTTDPQETAETAIASISNQEEATKPNVVDDKETIPPCVIQESSVEPEVGAKAVDEVLDDNKSRPEVE